MIPILFNNAAVTYTRHGIGDLIDTVSCETACNSEGQWELELKYPIDGILMNDIAVNNIILAKANGHMDPQAFRIYGIGKAINGIVTVRAQHISYDLAGIVVKDFESDTCAGAFSEMQANVIGSRANRFTFMTDIPNSQQAQNQERKLSIEEPSTIRKVLLDGDDSIHGCFGGDLVFDNFNVSLLKTGGADRGVLVEYGIDLMDLQQEENISEMITGVYPFWKGREEGDEHSEKDKIVYGEVQYAQGTFQQHRVIPLNVTEYYPNNTKAPSVSQINQTARDWIQANEIGQPAINLTLSYAHLGKDVRLHDAITVRFVKMGIDVKAKVVLYKYDTLAERCTEIGVGKTKPSILFSLEDASRLKRGLIPPKRIQNNSIDSDKLANASVGSGQIASGSVGSFHIVDQAVTTDKIAEEAITGEKIGKNEISSYNLGPLSVTEEKIAAEAVTVTKIGEKAVTGVKINDHAVTGDKIGLWENGVGTSNIVNHAVGTLQISDGSITSGKIGDSAVISTKINSAAVITEKLADGAVIYRKVSDGNIDTLKLNDFSITSSKLSMLKGHWRHNPPDATHADWWDVWVPEGDPAVGSDQMSDGCVVSAKIGDQEIGSTKFDEDLQKWVLSVDEAVTLVVNTLEFNEAEGRIVHANVVTANTINANSWSGHQVELLPKNAAVTVIGSRYA